jgi:hypothetical protein
MEPRLLSQLKPYLSHPEVARRLTRKKFAELQEERRWSGPQTRS